MVSSADVEMTVRLTLLATEPAPSGPATLTSTLRYSVSDPYAVSIVFPSGPGSAAVVWTFDRDLLRAGIEAEAGLGDVRIWPADAAEPEAAFIELTAPGGRALLSAPIPVLRRFLDAAAAAVGLGRESEYVDIDAELEALLGRTG